MPPIIDPNASTTPTTTTPTQSGWDKSAAWFDGLGKFLNAGGNALSPILNLFGGGNQPTAPASTPNIVVQNPPTAQATAQANSMTTWIIAGAVGLFAILLIVIVAKK